jgi:hypothetical protein
MWNLKRTVVVFFVVTITGCTKDNTPGPVVSPFTSDAAIKPVPLSFPGEVSGMADSYSRPGYIWMLEDGGRPASLITVSINGEQGPTLPVTGAENQDWEDMAIGNGPEAGKKYLYIADVGDNSLKHALYYIYRVEEPAAGLLQTAPADKFSFVYEDGQQHDADAILVDLGTNNIVIITKDIPSRLFELVYPYSNTSTNTALSRGQLKQSLVTGAAASPDGQEILLRTYSSMHYWKKSAGQSITAVLQQTAQDIPVVSEPQGESVCFKNDNGGFFTFSENAGLPTQLNLYFYARK